MSAGTRRRTSHPPVDPKRSLGIGDIRSLVAGGFRLVWESSHREALLVLALLAVQGVATSLLLVMLAKLAGGLIGAEGGGSTEGLPQDVILFLSANALLVVADVIVNQRRQLLGERAAMYAQGRILEVACLAELDDYDDSGFHDRLQRASRSAVNRPIMLVEALLEFGRAAFMLVGVLVGLVILEPWVALVTLFTVIPIWLGGTKSGEQYFAFEVETTQRDRVREYLFKLLTQRTAAKEIRAFDLGDHLSNDWRRLTDERISSFIVTLKKRFRSSMVATLGSNAIVALVAVALIALTRAEVMTLGEAAAVAGALLLFSQKLMDAVQATNMFFEAGPLIQDLQDFLTLKELLDDERPTGELPESFGSVELEHISFTYKGAEVRALDDVSLRLKAGEVVALVGENGSGKTTLTKLLSGLYQPDEGQVLVDGVDIATIDPSSWRRLVAVVFQDYLQFSLPARDNIRFGAIDREATDETIRAAAVAAGADRFLAALPKGYDTPLSPQFDDGQDLSLGQWQRVALARAFYRSAALVVLDEPTASLDARAERDLFEAVRDLYEGRTVLLISHRFSTVRTADRIVVLADGKVVEEGPHDELMRVGGLYAELFMMQASSYLDPEPDGPDDTGDTAVAKAAATG